MKTNDSLINIFFINSSFQLVSSILIAKDTSSFFFCFKKQNYEAAKDYGLKNVFLLKYREASKFARKLSTRENIRFIFSIIKDNNPKSINFHSTSISSTRYNYFIAASKKNFPEKKITFNIIPDGTHNLVIHPLSKNKLKRVNKRKKSLIDKAVGLKYTPFKEDRHGMLSNKVSHIYTIPGTSESLPTEKKKDLPPFTTEFSISPNNQSSRSALIIGQPLTNWGITDEASSKAISQNLISYLCSENIKDVLFIPHPTNRSDKKIEFCSEDFKIYSGSSPIELLMIKNQYDYVIGFSSTALITAKLIYGNSNKIVCIGKDLFNYKEHPMLKKIVSHFKEIGVDCMP
ncbi:polysialyltransferase family glycosyltransferase [Endozoicomonas sp. ALC020]|uniref:polysialyltransferase family glycosyltransferase n=1 Tax=unclassified Endozoicomonas TaxID=2644528 RepID=UPI003BB089F7